jgi:hypothetical protein
MIGDNSLVIARFHALVSAQYQPAGTLTHAPHAPCQNKTSISHWTAERFCNDCPGGVSRVDTRAHTSPPQRLQLLSSAADDLAQSRAKRNRPITDLRRSSFFNGSTPPSSCILRRCGRGQISRRIAEQEPELELLTKQRDKLSHKVLTVRPQPSARSSSRRPAAAKDATNAIIIL